MAFTALPTEILSAILSFVSPSDVTRCCQVSRQFRDLVATDEYLRYVYELGICGYTIPRNIRLDLSYTEKVQALRERRRAWQRKELTQPIFTEFPPGQLSKFCLANGTLAYISSTIEASGTVIRAINYAQLPSANKGTTLSKWHHDRLDLTVECLAIQPESDLVVLLEDAMLFMELGSDDGTVTQEYYEHYRLHVRTMSTNQSHPASSFIDGVYDLDIEGDGKMYRNRRFAVKTYGHLIAVQFSLGIPGPEKYKSSAIKIFDWVIGSEITQVEITGTERDVFCFISPEYFGVLNTPRPEGLDHHYPDLESHTVSSLGSLCIYKLPIHGPGIGRQTARRIATFALPQPRVTEQQIFVQLRCSIPQPLDPLYLDRLLPQTYEPTSESPLLCLNISQLIHSPLAEENYDAPPTQNSIGALFVPSQYLLDIAHQTFIHNTYPPSVPWDVWGCCANWFALSGLHNWQWFINGPRAIGLCLSPDHELNASNLLMLDLRHLRMGTKERGKQIFSAHSDLPVVGTTMGGSSDLREALIQAFDIANVVPEQAAVLVPMRGSRKLESVDELLVDDEHVVVLGELVRFRQVESRNVVIFPC